MTISTNIHLLHLGSNSFGKVQGFFLDHNLAFKRSTLLLILLQLELTKQRRCQTKIKLKSFHYFEQTTNSNIGQIVAPKLHLIKFNFFESKVLLLLLCRFRLRISFCGIIGNVYCPQIIGSLLLMLILYSLNDTTQLSLKANEQFLFFIENGVSS